LTGVLVKNERGVGDNTSGFHLIDLSNGHSVSYQALNHHDFPNDFAHRDSMIMFAPNRATRHGSTRVSMISLRPDGNVLNQRIFREESGFPLSDAFCIDASPSTSVMHSCFAMGHRNSQLSLIDSRAADLVCKSTAKVKEHSQNHFGAATSIKWLSNFEILASGSFGNCHVYDVRKMGTAPLSSKGQRSHKQEDPSLVHVLSLPPEFDHIRSKISKFCNGVATDQEETVAIAPFLNQDEQPCFGFWSLRTGHWFGYKVVVPWTNTSDARLHREVQSPPYLELCTNLTPFFGINGERKMTSNPSKGSSLWFKCGQNLSAPTEATVADSRGSIHQLSLGGHYFVEESA
jgi:hypothetical protein